MLTDKEIRAALLLHLRRLPRSPRAILEEVRVHNGNAIADVVAVHSSAHCYEIKGETDALRRILKQGEYYDLCFKKITLVTTSNHLKHSLSLAPPHWGILIAAEEAPGETRFRYMRKAITHPRFDKHLALLTLWRSELLKICDQQGLEKFNRASLAKVIAEKSLVRDVERHIGEALAGRQAKSGWSVAI